MIEWNGSIPAEMAFYPGEDLGASWKESETVFRLWAPTAEAVALRLYDSGDYGAPIGEYSMIRGKNGVWEITREGDLDGVYYTYAVTTDGAQREAVDPYARATGVNGQRGMVLDLRRTDPPGWEQDENPHPAMAITDAVICEMHVRDFSAHPSSGASFRGKFLAMAESGTKNRNGDPTGLDYLKALGVTHVQLLPIFDFGSVDESRPWRAQYNWGYDPVNFNVPEGSYSTDPFRGEVRVAELKSAIQAIHRRGIGVIMDVVYNHVYHADDFCFNKIVPGYFSRGGSNGSYCGNDTASERPMVRKYLADSVRYWAEEYHIDGFRLDLAGILDTETVRAMMDTVHRDHPDVFFYGEGWTMPTVPSENVSLTVQANAALVPGFGFFNDTIRDALRGSTFLPLTMGYAAGGYDHLPALRDCFLGRPSWAPDPGSVINYTSCHDNYTLADRLSVSLPHASQKEIARRSRLAASFCILSQGVPFFQLGEELLRSKPGFHGGFVDNSYRSPDRVNSIKWDRCRDRECRVTMEYYRGLIALRKAFPLFRLTSHEDVDRCIRTLPSPDPGTLAFLLENEDECFLVCFHPAPEPKVVSLPEGSWEALVLEDQAGTVPLDHFRSSAVLPPVSAVVFRREKQKCRIFD